MDDSFASVNEITEAAENCVRRFRTVGRLSLPHAKREAKSL
jgi:hypothetical protein